MGEKLTRIIRLVVDKLSLDQVREDTKAALDEGTKPPERNFAAIRAGLDRIRKVALSLGAVFAGVFSVVALTRFARSSIQAAQQIELAQSRLTATLQTVGVRWEDVAGQVSTATRILWDTHRLTGGEVMPILRELTQATGNYQVALNNVGLAADLAAAANMDQVTAARLLGRVLNGDTTALRRYGIVIEEGAEYMAFADGTKRQVLRPSGPSGPSGTSAPSGPEEKR